VSDLKKYLTHLPPFLLVTLMFISGLGLVVSDRAQAQSTPNRVGLVIQFKDSSIQKKCVEIDGDQAKGYDVLINAGLSIITDFNPVYGAGVCKIGNDGCNAGEDCFCDMPNYWSYWHLGLDDEGQPAWKYSPLGASSYTVQAGDVEGWHYGMMAPPSEIPSFEQICAAPTATLAAIAPTATYPPTQVSIPPTTPPKWATAVIIGPTPEMIPPTQPAPPTAASQVIPPTSAPAPTNAPQALQPTQQEQAAPTEQLAEASPTWSATQASTATPVITTSQEKQPTPTEAHASRLAMQEEQATPVDSSAPAAPVPASQADPSTGASKWLLIFGGLAGIGSFIGFFLVLLGGLLAVIFIRRR